MTILKRLSRVAVLAAWFWAGNNAFADGDLQFLWWGVGDDPGYDLATVLSSLSFVDKDGNSVSSDSSWVSKANAARVRVVENGQYLTTSDMEAYPTVYEFPDDPYPIPIEALADITSFTTSSPEYHFVVELGNWDDNGDWTHVADSESKTYKQLKNYDENGKSYIKTFSNNDWDANPINVWRPTTYVVPEPSGGMLVLLGAAGLLLRRRRKFRA